MTMKTCACCGEKKPDSEFHVDRSKSDGLNSSCKSCRRVIAKKSRANEDKEKRRAWLKKWTSENRESACKATAKWRSKHPDENKQIYKKWSAKNRDKINATKREKFANKKSVTPDWADKSAIKKIYRAATFMTKITGTQWEVDHKVPIHSKSVCGLHCEENLQVIPHKDNLKKSNRWWPYMW